MRWFKHLASSHDDEKISDILDKFGAEGYGIWWLILEKISLEMDTTSRCSIRLSVKSWAKFCRISAKKFRVFKNFCEKIKLFSSFEEEEYITIKCENLLKYRDEWTLRRISEMKKTPESLPSHSRATPARAEADTDTERKERASALLPIRFQFLEVLEAKLKPFNPTNSNLLITLGAWEVNQVTAQDVAAAIERRPGGDVPWYYKQIAIDIAKERRGEKQKLMTKSELRTKQNAEVLARLCAEAEAEVANETK